MLYVGILATGALIGGTTSDEDLLGLSIEQLGQVQVTATSRHASRLADTPASVYVIEGERIRSLGIRTLPEALRLAPNLQVAQVNAAAFAVSARGLKTSLSNKMLVLVDGRPVYTPLFAGVLWDMQDVPMADVDRIEVVSGPGAAAWGANAVNGVINVVMRPASESRGVTRRPGPRKMAAASTSGRPSTWRRGRCASMASAASTTPASRPPASRSTTPGPSTRSDSAETGWSARRTCASRPMRSGRNHPSAHSARSARPATTSWLA